VTDKKDKDETAVNDVIAGMGEFQAIGTRIHDVITKTAPELKPRLWYGMPGYAKTKSSPVMCFFRADDLVTFGLTEKANLTPEDSASDQLIGSAWFVMGMDEPTEARIADIVKRAVA
jgi:hypothetical protein